MRLLATTITAAAAAAATTTTGKQQLQRQHSSHAARSLGNFPIGGPESKMPLPVVHAQVRNSTSRTHQPARYSHATIYPSPTHPPTHPPTH